MTKMTTIKKSCICAICIAMCYVLPIAFHTVGLGSVFCPIHIPVLLCGLICGGFYGWFAGLLGPILSSILTGMPSPTVLVSMLPELMVYGLFTGILMKKIRTGCLYRDLYLALIPSMVLGRIAGGIARAIFVSLIATGDTYGFSLWVASYFVTNLPGILVQLTVLPSLVVILIRARVISGSYGSALKRSYGYAEERYCAVF